MNKFRNFRGGDGRGDGQKSSDQSVQNTSPDFLKRHVQDVESKKRALAGRGDGIGSSQEITEITEIPEIPENKEKQTKPYTKKSKKNRKKNGKAGKGTKNKQNQITMVGAEATGESMQFAGGEEKAREFYEIPQKAINTRFDGAKRLIASNYGIKEKQPLMRKMVGSAKDIWQSASRGEKEQQIPESVFKLNSPDLYLSNWGY